MIGNFEIYFKILRILRTRLQEFIIEQAYGFDMRWNRPCSICQCSLSRFLKQQNVQYMSAVACGITPYLSGNLQRK